MIKTLIIVSLKYIHNIISSLLYNICMFIIGIILGIYICISWALVYIKKLYDIIILIKDFEELTRQDLLDIKKYF